MVTQFCNSFTQTDVYRKFEFFVQILPLNYKYLIERSPRRGCKISKYGLRT